MATARRMIGMFCGEVDGQEVSVRYALLLNGDRMMLLINGDVAVAADSAAVAVANNEIMDRALGIPVEAFPAIHDGVERDHPVLIEAQALQLL